MQKLKIREILPKEIITWTEEGFRLLLKRPAPLILLSVIWVLAHAGCIVLPAFGPFLFPLVDAFLAPATLVFCLRLENDVALNLQSLPWIPKTQTFIPIVLIGLLAGFPGGAALTLKLPLYQKFLLFAFASALAFSVTTLAIPLTRLSDFSLFEALSLLWRVLWLNRKPLVVFLLIQTLLLAFGFALMWIPALLLLVPQLLATRSLIFFALFPNLKRRLLKI